MWGFLTCLNDILVPHLKSIFELCYARAMLVQFAFFSAYFLFSVPLCHFKGISDPILSFPMAPQLSTVSQIPVFHAGREHLRKQAEGRSSPDH
jgi:hypothetical protein